jgi:hypothetical protein
MMMLETHAARKYPVKMHKPFKATATVLQDSPPARHREFPERSQPAS